MNQPHVYLNGQFLPFNLATLSLHDAGFVWGATVVDNCRTYGGKLFRWAVHLARFRHDCQHCYVPLSLSDEELTQTAKKLIELNWQNQELQLVTFATPGPLGFYLNESIDGPPTIGMMTYPVPINRYRHFFTEGVTLVAAINPHFENNQFHNSFLSPQVKHRSRMSWWVAEKAKLDVGYPKHAVPLFFDHKDSTPTETAFANLIAVQDGCVITPPRHLVLDGISLRVVEELCRSLSIPFHESTLNPFCPPNISEAMLVGTGLGIAGVREFLSSPQSSPVHFDWPGPIFQQLKSAWSNEVGKDIEREFLSDS